MCSFEIEVTDYFCGMYLGDGREDTVFVLQ